MKPLILAAALLVSPAQPMVTLRLTQQHLLMVVQGLQGLPYREAAPLLGFIQAGIVPAKESGDEKEGNGPKEHAAGLARARHAAPARGAPSSDAR